MKLSWLVYLFIIVFLSGCASSNAFTKFHLTPHQQYAFSNLQLSDISYNQKFIGTVTAIYLNNIFPKKYHHDEYFYVVVYLQNNGKLEYILNGQNPTKITQLPKNNQFSSLLPVFDNWHRYYLVQFKHIKEDHLVFQAKQAKFHSYALRYLKTLR